VQATDFSLLIEFVLSFLMVVTVNIPDELAAAAKARGLSLEAYVQEILAQQLARPAETQQARTPEEIRTWLDSLAQFSDKIPPLPETISREWLYQDHD
jgi:post-segregation antitoxin (ccd killing protein)